MRRIHQLHLSAPTRPLVGRGARLLEDAFHTASLPFPENSGLVFIRQFNVGTIHPSQSPTSLSRQLEQQLQHITATALPGTHPGAAAANVVTFPDDLTAYAHFAHRLTTGQSLQAWFWQKLLPNWHPSQSIYSATQSLLTQLASHELGPLATAIVFQSLSKQAMLTNFLSSLQPAEGRNYLNLYGWPLNSSTKPPIQGNLRDFASQSTLSALPKLDWPLADARSQWIIALALIAKTPSLTDPAEIHRCTWQQLQIYSAGATPLGQALSTLDENTKSTESPALSHLQLTKQLSQNASNQSLKQQPSNQKQSQSKNEEISSSTALLTQYGGVGYLLNALEQLNFSRYLPQYSQPNIFVYRLLNYIARRQAHAPSQSSPQALTDPFFNLDSPAYLRRKTEAVHTDYPQNEIDIGGMCPYRAWYCALRTYLHRHTQLSLFETIHRPARFSLTASHLDITFPLNQVDIRLRRAGLDLNPGWLPWVGRVVQFHYAKQL